MTNLHTSPVARLAVVVLELVPVFLSFDPFSPLPFAALALIHTVFLARVRFSRLARVVLPLAILPISLFVLNLLFTSPEPDDTFRQIWFLLIRERALHRALTLSVRSMAMILLSVGYLLSTDPLELVNALMQQLGLSSRVGYSLYVAWNTMPHLRQDLRRIQAAHRVRLRGRPRRVKDTLPVAVTLLTGAIRHAERAATSMQIRGLEHVGRRTFVDPLPWRGRDTLYVVGFTLLTAGILLILIRQGLFVFGLG